MDPSHSNGTFRTLIDDSISESGLITRSEISAQKPVRVTYDDPYLAWNYTATVEMGAKMDLFMTLTYNTTLFELGRQIFNVLKQRSSGPVVAVHLRGEADWPSGFGKLDMQIDLYTEALQKLRKDNQGGTNPTNITDVYVSCGDATSIQTFQERLDR